MQGRLVLITGANSGIGLAAARALGRAGAHLLVHGRDAAKVRATVGALEDEAIVAKPAIADFTSLADVAQLARALRERFPRLDVLVNNAGLMHDRLQLTGDGYERVFQVNHLAPFLLTSLLTPLLDAAPAPRVVTVASGAHGMARTMALDDIVAPKRYDGLEVYARSKAANILFTQELARRAPTLHATALHPGVVRTGFAQDGDVVGATRLLFLLVRPFMLSAEQGADTLVWLASGGGDSGGYYVKRKPRAPRTYARDPATAAALWSLSKRLVEAHLPAEQAHG